MSILSNLMGSDSAKLAQRAQGKATKTAERNWEDTAGLRKIGTSRLTNPTAVDFSADFAGGPQYEAVSDPLYGQATGAASRSLASLTDTPDRAAMVRQALADLDRQNAPRLDAGIRKIGQRAATLGRVGMEGVGTEIGDLGLAIESDRATKANALIRDAIEGAQADKYRTLDAASGIANSAYSRGASERANKQGIAQQGITNRAARIDAERAANNDTFGQGVSLTSLGYGFSPEGAYERQAANEQAIGDRKAATFGDVIGGAASLATGGLLKRKPKAGG